MQQSLFSLALIYVDVVVCVRTQNQLSGGQGRLPIKYLKNVFVLSLVIDKNN